MSELNAFSHLVKSEVECHIEYDGQPDETTQIQPHDNRPSSCNSGLFTNLEALLSRLLTASQHTCCATAQPVTSTNPVQLIHFNPDDADADIEGWCRVSELIVDSKKLSGVDLLVALTSALKGRAASCLTKLCLEDLTWETVKQTLLVKFAKHKLIQDYFDDILRFQTEALETASEAAVRLWELIERIPKVVMPEEVITGFVVSVLSSKDDVIRRELNSYGITTRAQLFRILGRISLKRRAENNERGASTDTLVSSSETVRVSAPNVALVGDSVPVACKRIRLAHSDSVDNALLVERPAPTPILSQPSLVTQNELPKPVSASTELTAAVKEKRFRNMLEMFPEVSPMFVKNTLIKHSWNEERTRDEILRYDPENRETCTSTLNGSRSGFVRTNVATVTSGDGKDRASDSSDSEKTDDLVKEKRKVFEFLNNSNMNELFMLSGCSKKKAEAIIAQRPFKGWPDMVQKFNNDGKLSTDLINTTQELLAIRKKIQRLMKKCFGLAQQLEAAGETKLQQPTILKPSLKLAPYQVVGLNWLAVLHKQGVSGILADEMGLGKTVQVISFLAHLKETGQARGPHLIVVPASTLDTWSAELARWCPALRVSKYHGSFEDRRQLRFVYSRSLDKYDIFLTTYTLVKSCPEDRKFFRCVPLHYVIYDEAHMLKNMSTDRCDVLLKIQSKHRLLLTGTPLQNNLLELMSLLCFVMPHMFSGKTDKVKSYLKILSHQNAKHKGTKKSEDEDYLPAFEKSQITQATRILKPFVLRRLKNDVLQDLRLFTKEDSPHCILTSMSDKQEKLYEELCADSQ